MSSSVSAEWIPTELGSISEHITKGATPTTYGFDWEDSGIYFLRSECVKPYRLSPSGAAYISPEAHQSMKRSIVKAGDVLISITGYIGASCIFPTGLGEANINQHIARIRVESQETAKFIMYYLNSEPMQREFRFIQTGQAYPQLSLKQLHDTVIPLPPPNEAKKIASILTSVDEVIEKTQSQIAKLQDLKTGMMQELLTKGIGHTEFKDSPVGRIPVGWEVQRLGPLIKNIYSGWSPVCEARERTAEEWGILKTTAVVWDGYDPTKNKVLEGNLKPVENAIVQDDDILVTRKGPRERVGVCVYVEKTPEKLMVPDTVFRIILSDADPMFREYVNLALSSDSVQKDWDRKKVGLAEAQVNVNHDILKATLLPIPPKAEMQEVCKAVKQSNSILNSKRSRLESLRRLKKALMQDLLTGKVRAKAD